MGRDRYVPPRSASPRRRRDPNSRCRRAAGLRHTPTTGLQPRPRLEPRARSSLLRSHTVGTRPFQIRCHRCSRRRRRSCGRTDREHLHQRAQDRPASRGAATLQLRRTHRTRWGPALARKRRRGSSAGNPLSHERPPRSLRTPRSLPAPTSISPGMGAWGRSPLGRNSARETSGSRLSACQGPGSLRGYTRQRSADPLVSGSPRLCHT